MKEDFNPEILYEYLKQKDWKKFLYTLSKKREIIFSNPVALNATKYFLSEFQKSVNKNTPELYIEEFDIIILLHEGKYFTFGDEEYSNILKLKIYGQSKTNPNEAYKFAINYSQYDFALKYCEAYEEKLPVKVSHSFEDNINVTHNKNISNEDLTIPLFKSEREINFFNATKELFPNYHTYPNVAISCVLDYNKIASKITNKQKEYFLKSIVDCVVFDSMANYKAKYFFEIDSSFHDTNKAKIKDSWKDTFFSMAGKKLYRIRPIGKSIDKEMFVELLKEVLNK